MKESSVEHYANGARVLAKITGKFTGVPVSDRVVSDWTTAMIAIRHSDDVIDSAKSSTERGVVADQALSYLAGRTDNFAFGESVLGESLGDLKVILGNVDTRSQDFFIRSVRNILKVNEKIKVTKSAFELSRLRKLEGQITSRLLITFMDNKEPDTIRMLSRLTRVANLLDSALDIKQDYADGQVNVRPTLPNKAVIVFSSFRDNMSLVSGFAKRKVIGLPLVESAIHVFAGRDRKTTSTTL